MHDYDTQKTFTDLVQTFEEFKKTNDTRLENLEGKLVSPPELENKMDQLQDAMDQAEKRLKKMEVHSLRPLVETTSEKGCPHTKAFLDYLRKGAESALQDYETKSLTVGSERDGGYLVPSGLETHLHATLQESSVMRGIANVREISSSALEMLIDKDSADAGWVAETAERKETKTPELAKIRIPVHEMYARPRATQKLLDDASLNVEEWLSQKIAQKMAMMENTAFISGDGNNKPKGILACETTVKDNWTWGKLEEIKTELDGGFKKGFEADTLLLLFYSLKPSYLPGASWLMSRQTQGTLRTLKDPDNHQYLWQPPLAAMPTPTLLGYPVIISDDMPALTPKKPSKSILFGNFKEGYQIVDRTGFRVLRDPYSSKPYVEFYATRRVGGDILNYQALKVLNFAA